jgi:hypothetical protein
VEREKMLKILAKHEMALEWTITNIKGDHLTLFMNKILMKENSKPITQLHWQLNPTL